MILFLKTFNHRIYIIAQFAKINFIQNIFYFINIKQPRLEKILKINLKSRLSLKIVKINMAYSLRN